ncbi:MAG TPA: hypothetical protein VI146_08440 [Nitrososphaeraceae archaeon]
MIVASFLFLIAITLNISETLALKYANFTRDKYQIQFQYPSDWVLEEKANGLKEESEIDVSNKKIGTGEIAIHYYNDLLKSFNTTNFDHLFSDFYNERSTGDFMYDYRTVEPPSFFNVDGQKTGSFLVIFKQKAQVDPIDVEVKYWITFEGNTGYVLEFLSTPENFNTSENLEIRDRFIESIDFIGSNNTTDVSGRISNVAKLKNN